ncbi:MAG: efflux transporter, family, subunit [Phycisphaerales bacterium]|nr:efflux transporter, family, subunit [Phycisphaerales bacterium]
MKRTARIRLALLLWLAVAILLAGASFAAVRAFTLPQVQVTHLTSGPVVQAFYATGTVQPEREYSVHANVAGILFLEPGIDKGLAVKKDQLLARVISDDLDQKLKQTEAELKEKRARADDKDSPVLAEYDKRIEAYTEILALAKREMQRLLTLAETDNARPVEIERAQDRVKTTWAELEAARAQRAAKVLEVRKDLEVAQAASDMAKWNSQQQEIRSPIDGIILDWPSPNRTRQVINDTVLTLADVRPEKLVMRAAVDEEDKNKLRIGQLVQMTLYSFPNDKDKFTGHVKTIYHKADPQRRTFEVDVEIDRPTTQPTTAPNLYDQFSPGMTGELAFIEQAKKEANILPRQALQGDSFFLVRNGKLERVAAQPGVKNVTRVEVLAGVEPDALVLLSPIGTLQPGQSVRTQFVDPRQAADLNKPPDAEIFKGGF